MKGVGTPAAPSGPKQDSLPPCHCPQACSKLRFAYPTPLALVLSTHFYPRPHTYGACPLLTGFEEWRQSHMWKVQPFWSSSMPTARMN